jgi:hypothetical protein
MDRSDSVGIAALVLTDIETGGQFAETPPP